MCFVEIFHKLMYKHKSNCTIYTEYRIYKTIYTVEYLGYGYSLRQNFWYATTQRRIGCAHGYLALLLSHALTYAAIKTLTSFYKITFFELTCERKE